MGITDQIIKDLLIKATIIDENGLNSVIEYAKSSGVPLAEAVIEKDIVSDEQLGMLLSDYLKVPFVSLSKLSVPEDVFHIIPEKMARKQKIIPFEITSQGVKLAMADPTNKEVQDMIIKKTGVPVIPHLATERDIFNTLKIYRKDLQVAFDALLEPDTSRSGKIIPKDAPTSKIVDGIINYGYQDKASDIHIEPQEHQSLVRFRIDGILHDVLILPKSLHDQVVTRIKVLSRLRTDEHLSPQDGKMRIKLDEEDLDIRVSILPLAEGEKIVLRLLASRFRLFSLIDLGMNEADLKKVNNAYNKSYGMILSTGPTGSGKTTSIYAVLKILNTREKNITTIEDPVEYRIKGVNQIQVNVKTDLTFASGLRSILRQDPNVIFVGEIRDNETAGIAVNAALTGHLVLSTLHTNDAATALPRLTDMKVEPFLVASTVNVIIAQRLIRKICDMCKSSVVINRQALVNNVTEAIVAKHFGSNSELKIYKGRGCKICHNTGYVGRIGIFEVLEVSKEVKKLIQQKMDSDVIVKQAIAEGMTTMLDDGLNKVVRGYTTLEEVLRVTKVEVL